MELRVDAARISDQLDQTLVTMDGGARSVTQEATAAVQDFRTLARSLNDTADRLNTTLDRIAPNLAQFRSEEHTSELQSLMRISYAVFCLKKKKQQNKARE